MTTLAMPKLCSYTSLFGTLKIGTFIENSKLKIENYVGRLYTNVGRTIILLWE